MSASEDQRKMHLAADSAYMFDNEPSKTVSNQQQRSLNLLLIFSIEKRCRSEYTHVCLLTRIAKLVEKI